MNVVQQTILARRSIRDYEPTQLSEEQLQTLIDAALASPSAVNSQPWHFTVVQDQALLNRIHEATKEQLMKNPATAGPRWADPNFHVFYHAPTVIILSADTQPGTFYANLDCGIAVQNIAISAEALGLGSVILGMPRAAFEGEHGDELRKALQLPEHYDYKIAIAVGTPRSSKDPHPIGEGKVNYIR